MENYTLRIQSKFPRPDGTRELTPYELPDQIRDRCSNRYATPIQWADDEHIEFVSDLGLIQREHFAWFVVSCGN